MIEELYVKDYVLFKKDNLFFDTGMTVITGETGAGKSLLIDAINLLSGQRAQTNVVANNADRAVLQMTLLNPSNEIVQLLEDNGYECDDQIIIQRSLNSQSKSSIRINQQQSTLSFVKSLVSKIIDVHSQMDTYKLMDQNVQLDLLDHFAKTEDLKKQVKDKYFILTKCENELKKACEQTFSEDALEYATNQFNEINDANIKENELEELTERIKQVSIASKSVEDLNASIYSLDKENGILDSLYILNKTYHKNHWDFSIQIEDMYHELSNLSENLKNQRESLERDSIELDNLQEREYLIKRMFRKHGGSYKNMCEAKDKYLDTIDRIIHRQAVIDRLTSEVESAKQAYFECAMELSQARQSVFLNLCKEIEYHCHDLMLEKAKFKIDRQEKKPSLDGIDDINFMVSMNPGQPFSLLKHSASGGELSRLMLALKVVFQSQQGIQTIIFDEIDTGVSGKVAFAMGQKMKMLSKDYQVLCITHLASVAAWADHHFKVEKNTLDDQTTTTVTELDDVSILEELATMSSGSITPTSIEAARELKNRCQNG